MPQEPTTSTSCMGYLSMSAHKGVYNFSTMDAHSPGCGAQNPGDMSFAKIYQPWKVQFVNDHLGYLVHIQKDKNNENVSFSPVESNNKPDKHTNADRGKKSKILNIKIYKEIITVSDMDWGSQVHTCIMGILKDWGLNLWKSDGNGTESMWKSHGLDGFHLVISACRQINCCK